MRLGLISIRRQAFDRCCMENPGRLEAWYVGSHLPVVHCLRQSLDTARPWGLGSCWEWKSEYCAGTNVSPPCCDQVRADGLAEIDKLLIG